MLVGGHEIHVRRDERAKVLAERQVHGRTVVQRADAHVEHVAGGLRRFARETSDEVGVELALLENARAAAGEPQQVPAATLVDRQKRIEHGGHENRAARMDFHCGVELGGIGRCA